MDAADLQEQLEELRRRMKAAAQRADNTASAAEEFGMARASELECAFPIEQALNGQVVETPQGQHFQCRRLWERHKRHGSMDISDLEGLPPDLLEAISEGEIQAVPPARWAFIDTESTGLVGGAGTCAFLAGIGRIRPEGFALTQYFMRDFCDEPSMLHAVSESLADADVVVSYNGKTYDIPLLETRYRLARMKPPFERMAHLDLLHGARRLWKLRLESCRLTELEQQILGVEREGDIAGDMIPFVYFEYLRRKEAWKLAPIFLHNALDIVTLACLTAIVPWVFRSPEDARFSHGAEMVGLARWLRKANKLEQALALMRRGVEWGLKDDLLFRALCDIAALEKKLRREPAAVAVWSELAGCRNVFQAAALEELAKFYEHREKKYAMALEFTEAALRLAENDELQRRRQRLIDLARRPK